MSGLFIKKSIARLISDSENPMTSGGHGGGKSSGLQRTLGPLSTITLGIGAIIGAGIFTLTGEAAAAHSGPGIVYSFIIAGILCTLAGLCYSEMAAMIPVSGSAYAYTYATMGEGMAWMTGWTLTLQYAFGAAVVAGGWSGYLLSLLRKTMNIQIPDIILSFTKGPLEKIILDNGQEINGVWNIPASLIVILLTAVLYKGIGESTKINSIMVFVKMAIVILFIGLGIGVVSWANLNANPDASGLASLVPVQETVWDSTLNSMITRYGWLKGGVATGAGAVFYAYLGFDAVSTVSQEAKNPKRDIPIGILGSLLICTIVYILMGITLTGVINYKELHTLDPIALGIDKIVALRQWSTGSQFFLTVLVKLGVVAGLSTVILVLSLSQTRIWYAMSLDGLLPWFRNLHPRYQSPHIATVVTGMIAALSAGYLPGAKIAAVISLGGMLIFSLVCISVPIMRLISPEIKRPFKVPFVWLTSSLGAISCIWVMSNIDYRAWSLLSVFLTVGFNVYLIYGRRHSIQQIESNKFYGPLCIDYISAIMQIIGLLIIIKGTSSGSTIIGFVMMIVSLTFSLKNSAKSSNCKC